MICYDYTYFSYSSFSVECAIAFPIFTHTLTALFSRRRENDTPAHSSMSSCFLQRLVFIHCYTFHFLLCEPCYKKAKDSHTHCDSINATLDCLRPHTLSAVVGVDESLNFVSSFTVVANLLFVLYSACRRVFQSSQTYGKNHMELHVCSCGAHDWLDGMTFSLIILHFSMFSLCIFATLFIPLFVPFIFNFRHFHETHDTVNSGTHAHTHIPSFALFNSRFGCHHVIRC